MTMPTAVHADVERLLDIINANWTTQAVGVAAELRIADVLFERSRGVEELAEAISCNIGFVRRLMRALTCLGICSTGSDGSYELAGLGQLLRSDVQPSMRSWAIWSSQCQWSLWGELLETVRTGVSARERATGATGYAHLVGDADMAAVFYQAMVDITRQVSGAVAHGCDLDKAHVVVDLGGGHAELLVAVLNAHPGLKGVLFDLPHAVEGARSKLRAAGLEHRCEIVGGNFFEAVPADADVYMLKSILHNWNDEHCAAILETCRRNIASTARLIVIERVMPEHTTGSSVERSVIRSDLNMMIGFGGRERTRHEFAALLATAGFELQHCDYAGLGFSLLQATCAS